MMRINETEEIISLIHNGFDLELLSFELELPIEQIEDCKRQLELREFVRKSIKNGRMQIAIEHLKDFIEGTENNIVEKMMLLKLQAYIDGVNVDEEDLQKLKDEKERLGLSRDIDEILNEFKIQVPKMKNKKQDIRSKLISNDINENDDTKVDYENVIKRYKEEISKNSRDKMNKINKMNLLAFAYFRAGKVDEARDELLFLIEKYDSFMAYRQLIHLEKSEGNLEDAKLWAYECLDKFPNEIRIREQLISIARLEKDNQEIIEQLRECVKINPENEKSRKMLERIQVIEER